MFDAAHRDGKVPGTHAPQGRRASALPSSMAEMTPGLMLTVLTTSCADEELSINDRLEMLRAHQRLVAHYQAKVYRNIADLTERITADWDGDLAMGAEAVATEVRAVLRYTRRLAESEVEIATACSPMRAPLARRSRRDGSICGELA